MSDISINIPAWPFLVAGGIAAIIAALLLRWALASSGWRRWLAGGLCIVAAVPALGFGTLGLLLAAGY
ncbi:MAG: hypothetical protein JWO26_351 [Rhodospirillales bacterium]|jgi:hypothetical protein|nr:hypothetical protein [Rhodospirillales bacterium]MDB5380719.1 hypothetical protein [Rhodospirillales bacterium]